MRAVRSARALGWIGRNGFPESYLSKAPNVPLLAFRNRARCCPTLNTELLLTESRRLRLECETFSRARLKTVAEDAMFVSIVEDEF